MEIMKKILVTLALVTVGNFASASAPELPNCWTEESVPGSYVVAVKTASLSKVQLLNLMNIVNGRHITPKGYPSVSTSSPWMFIHVEARPVFGGTPKQALVEAEMVQLLQFPDVQINCNFVVSPQPRMGVGN